MAETLLKTLNLTQAACHSATVFKSLTVFTEVLFMHTVLLCQVVCIHTVTMCFALPSCMYSHRDYVSKKNNPGNVPIANYSRYSDWQYDFAGLSIHLILGYIP